jgi:putative transposon-encoded protein
MNGKRGKGKKKATEKEITIKLYGSEIIERHASRFGTGAHVVIPKEYTGKKVKIIFEKEAK